MGLTWMIILLFHPKKWQKNETTQDNPVYAIMLLWVSENNLLS